VLWRVTIGVVLLVWGFYFGVVVPLAPRYQWISLALELSAASALILAALNSTRGARRRPAMAYHLTALWGASLPLLIAYLSELIARGDAAVLMLNVAVLISLYAWGMCILGFWEVRSQLLGGWFPGSLLSALGAGIFTGTWGWFTLGDWPMMPYWSYMMEKSPLYLGLGLGFLGAYLIRPRADRGTDRFPGSIAMPLGGSLALVVLLLLPPLLLPTLVMLLLVAYWQRAVSGTPWVALRDDGASASSRRR
jgi:hypothetical protein